MASPFAVIVRLAALLAVSLALWLVLAPNASAAEFWSPSFDIESGTEAALYDTDGSGFSLTVYDGPSLLYTTAVAPNGVHRSTQANGWSHETCIHSKGVYRYVASDDHAGAVNYQVDYIVGGKTLGGSAMLPMVAYGMDHYVANYHTNHPTAVPMPFIVVMAPTPLNVQVTTPLASSVLPGMSPLCPVAGIAPGMTGTYALAAGEALVLAGDMDMTGTRVLTSRPAAVYAGNWPTKVGGNAASDVILEPVRSIERGGKEFVACYPTWVTAPGFQVMVRVLALQPGTTSIGLSDGQTGTLFNAGEYQDFWVTQHVTIQSSSDVATYLYLWSGWNQADSGMVSLVPRHLWQTTGVLDGMPPQAADIVPVTNRVSVAMFGTAAATVGGTPILGWQPVGSTGASCGEHNMGTTSGPITAAAQQPMMSAMLSTGAYSSAWWTPETPPACAISLQVVNNRWICNPPCVGTTIGVHAEAITVLSRGGIWNLLAGAALGAALATASLLLVLRVRARAPRSS